jgi:imidazolonepropionase-like amidohydrolase
MVAWGMRLPEIGTIEAGKAADLVLFAESPLEDITATLDPRLVVKDGLVVHEAA